MIQELHETHRPGLAALLLRSPVYNLFMLGNLEAHGFDQPFCQFWGDVGEDGRVSAVLNRYMTGWVIFGQPGADWAGLAAILDDHPIPAQRLQDNPGGIASWLPYLRRHRAAHVDLAHLMALDQADFRPVSTPRGIRVRQAQMADFPALIELFADAGSMSRSPAGVERPLRDGRIWLAEVANAPASLPNPPLSVALTNAESWDRAMIGGVFTPPAYRNQGLSQAVCSALCQDLFADAKQPVLYWENPAAGSVYRKLGFQEIGIWRSVNLARQHAEG